MDKLMQDDLSVDNITPYEEDIAQIELEGKRDNVRNSRFLFEALLFLLAVLYIFAGVVTCLMLNTTSPVPATNTVITVTLIMVPTILTLALMRFMLGNHQQSDEKNIPSVSLNFGKELISLIKEIKKEN